MVKPLASWVERPVWKPAGRCQPVRALHSSGLGVWSWAMARRFLVKTQQRGECCRFLRRKPRAQGLAAGADAELRNPAPLFLRPGGERPAGNRVARSEVLRRWQRLESRFGAALARLHPGAAAPLKPRAFGWEHDNYIGSGLQINGLVA